MGSTDYAELEPKPEKTRQTTRTAVANAVHLVNVLKDRPYPTS